MTHTETQAMCERLDEMRLAEILARSDGATVGPWIRSGVRRKMRDEDCIMVGQDGFMIIGLPIGRGSQQADALRDAEFIAHAREDVPYLLALLTRQQETIAKYRARLEVDHVFRVVDGEMVRVECPEDDYPDGIECRDVTISELEGQLDAKQETIERLKETVANLEFVVEDLRS